AAERAADRAVADDLRARPRDRIARVVLHVYQLRCRRVVQPTTAGEVMSLLSAQAVNVVYEPARGQRIWSVRDVDLELAEGEFVGLVGECGCGKSTLGYALTRMQRPPARLEGGTISFDGTDIASLEGEDLRRQRRNGFALVLQSGMNALNPVRTIENHFGDILHAHGRDGEDW